MNKTHSGTLSSNNTPFTEAQLKMLNCRAALPGFFTWREHARSHSADLVPWHNTARHHVGLGPLAPHDVHHRLAAERVAARAGVLAATYVAHPERFVNHAPRPSALPAQDRINPPGRCPLRCSL